jgi:hypothetical protein
MTDVQLRPGLDAMQSKRERARASESGGGERDRRDLAVNCDTNITRIVLLSPKRRLS